MNILADVLGDFQEEMNGEADAQSIEKFLQKHSEFIPNKISALSLKDILRKLEAYEHQCWTSKKRACSPGKIIHVNRSGKAANGSSYHEQSILNDRLKYNFPEEEIENDYQKKSLSRKYSESFLSRFEGENCRENLYDESALLLISNINDFAKTPPRPIFKDEYKTTVLKRLSAAGHEWSLVAQFVGRLIY